MRPYEAMVVLRPALEETALEAILSRLTSVITGQGGEITHVDQWGKRRLAYVIDDHIEGFYVVIKFQGSPGITTELERIMRISDAVLRFLVVRDETPGAIPAAQTPSAAPAGEEADEAEASDEAEATAAGDAEAPAEAEQADETPVPAEAEGDGTPTEA